MDLLSKLVGGSSASPIRQANSNTLQQRSIRFKKAHDQLQSVWRKNNSSKQLVSAEQVLACLESIETILQDEVQTPAPHLCARHVSTFKIYSTLAQIASTYNDELIFHEALDIFKILIDCEEVDFLEDKGFADALIGFVGIISTTGPLMVSVDTEGRIVEVLFGIASKIRLQPELLPTWFRPSNRGLEDATDQGGMAFNTKAEKDVFPLFYLTLDYVHHDGRVGDFARTGLLYIIESATHSETLERWIVESDLATLMASGLGALYSQLSRKLVLSFAKDSVPAIVSFSETGPPQIPRNAEETTSSDFQAHLATFLSYLVFWQDILEHCSSEDVKQSLLDHFKFLFLQQLLYPSLIESSDIDGGSSVAVLTYLRCIIESIDHADLLYVTLQYLLALPEKVEKVLKPARPTTLARRRKSQNLISNLAQGQEKPMPDLFTLVDLVLTGLKSRNQQTVTATLRLISVILRSHHQYAVLSIIKTQIPGEDLSTRAIGAHSRDTEALFCMAEDLMEHDDLGEAYEAHLEDARTLLESHCCSSQLLALPGPAVGQSQMPTHKGKLPVAIQPHVIRLADPLLESLLSLLEDFLANDISTNLGLTQAFATLASCGNTRLDGWILGGPVHHTVSFARSISSEDGTDHDDTLPLKQSNKTTLTAGTIVTPEDSKAFPIERDGSAEAPSHVFAVLDNLVSQVERFRQSIQDFDTYLAERRHVFKVGEHIDKAVANDLVPSRKSEERKSGESTRAIPSQGRGVPPIGSISERLMSETTSSDVSRSSSPRGRQPSDSSSSTLVDRLNHLRISPSPSPSKPASRKFSPSPLQKDSLASTPPKRVVTPMGPADALHRKVKVMTKFYHDRANARDIGSSETSSIRSESTIPEAKITEGAKEISLSQLLTNVILLQEFILELVAIIQVRASLFGEVAFV